MVQLTLALVRPDLLLEEVTADFRRRIPERIFELSLPASLPEISVDAAKIRQVLENLLGNAVKFSPAGSCIRVQALQQADRIEVMVVDEGVGMGPQALSHIFDRFYRGAADPSIAGLGLGMSIVKNIVEAHGGEISVESTLGHGTRVTFTLPCRPETGQN
jgi:signal transduction histidine kinase